MANPPKAVIEYDSGYPVFVSQDSAGTQVTPTGSYVWNGTLWAPWPVDSNGNPQMSLTGSNVPLVAAAPKLISTVPYTDLVTGGTYYDNIATSLTRNARDRTFHVYNTTDVNVTSLTFGLVDSAVGNEDTGYFQGQTFTDTTTTPHSQGASVYTSRNSGILAANTDSLQVGITIGATGATSGDIKIYVTELF